MHACACVRVWETEALFCIAAMQSASRDVTVYPLPSWLKQRSTRSVSVERLSGSGARGCDSKAVSFAAMAAATAANLVEMMKRIEAVMTAPDDGRRDQSAH